MALGFTQLDGKENAWGEDGGGLFGGEGEGGGGMLGFGADLFGEEGGQSQRSYRLISRSKREDEVQGSEEYRRESISVVDRSISREEVEGSRQEYAGRFSGELGRNTSVASVEARSAAEDKNEMFMPRRAEKIDKQSGGVTASRPLCPLLSITAPHPKQPTAPVSVQTSIPTAMQTTLVSAPCLDCPKTSLGCAQAVAATTSIPLIQPVLVPAPIPQLSLVCRGEQKSVARPGLQPMQMPTLAKPTTGAAGPPQHALQVTPASREDVKSGSELPKPPAKADPAPAVHQPTALAAMLTLGPAKPVGVPVKPMAVRSMQLSLAPVARPPALPLPAAPRPVQTSVQPPLSAPPANALGQSLSNRTNSEQTSSVCINKNNNQVKSASAGLDLQKTVKLTIDGNQSRLVSVTTPADTGVATHHQKLPLPVLQTVPAPPSVGRLGSQRLHTPHHLQDCRQTSITHSSHRHFRFDVDSCIPFSQTLLPHQSLRALLDTLRLLSENSRSEG
jgi:hypothetical protein